MPKKSPKASEMKKSVGGTNPPGKKKTSAKNAAVSKEKVKTAKPIAAAKLKLDSKIRAELVAELKSELVAELKDDLVAAIRAELAQARDNKTEFERTNSDDKTIHVDRSEIDKSVADGSGPKEGVGPRTKATFRDEVPAWFIAVEKEKQRRHPVLREQYFRAREVLEKNRLRLMAMPEVTGLHVGFRRKNDEIVFPLEYCIRVSVQKKRSSRDPRVVNLLDTEIEGVRVDVSERSFEILAEEQSSARSATTTSSSDGKPFDNSIFDPIRGGIVIANEHSPDNWGTLGIVLSTESGKKVGLTCQHVAGRQTSKNNSPPSDDLILQPSILGGNGPKRAIGRVRDAIRNWYVDAAVIEIDTGINSEREMMVGANRGFLEATLISGRASPDKLAFIIGATSDPSRLVRGTIRSTTAEIKVKGFGTMYDQITVEKFADSSNTHGEPIRGGDSGSILLMESSVEHVFKVVGIAHASTDDKRYLVASHWDHVMSSFPDLVF